MTILKSALTWAIAIPITLALALTACSADFGFGTAPTSSSASVVAGGASTASDVTTLALKKYTMATVRKHHTRTNCWTVIGKGVYKLTAFVNKHPGGAKRIIALCGKKGTTAFRAQHGTGGRANTVLKRYKIGVLA